MNNDKKRICVCFFGVIGRSIRFTYDKMVERMIDPLKTVYDVDVYVFNLDVGTTVVDGRPVNAMNYNIIKMTYYEEYKQEELDDELDALYETGMFKMRRDYTAISIRNAVRQMYSECRVGMFLENNQDKYSAAVICGPDYYLLNRINMYDVERCMSEENIIYTTDVNEGDGYTNGFYIGHTKPMIKILKRYEIIDQLMPTTRDYEYLLKKTFEIYGIQRKLTDMLFVKIRNNDTIRRQGKMRYAKYRYLLTEIQLKTGRRKIINPDLGYDARERPTISEETNVYNLPLPPPPPPQKPLNSQVYFEPQPAPRKQIQPPRHRRPINYTEEITDADFFYTTPVVKNQNNATDDCDDIRKNRGCSLMGSTNVQKNVNSKPNPPRIIPRNRQQPPTPPPPPPRRTPAQSSFNTLAPKQPVNIQPLQSSNRVKRKQNPQKINNSIRQNSIRSQLRFMKITTI
tara:strand:+ start:320 stop:1687 length:1368 start_codon:yes stop_codon:yes gene_type:complete